ncbi:single-stranded DNA-binding protein [Aerococcus kribbianus]|uniref:Single-stranded DNA-binding protein n=1 Tax=Aerococcus kribbianus TaxID=2999064 RepID=A0A9X3FWK6_9LACT|nr:MULTISPECIES: single-stranded DNA-binding protein [unclassified Aerococcus]MCZ0717569.1 single-stranded DNA-binding protein [Aerococcus sp. YH-aer221]MCZ0725857.1 single-stranded DNA-binding protein [Aerococcus sp. YH-aer222]
MINNVVLVGRLTRDVDLRYTQNGTAVGSFTVAVERSFKNAQGERQTDFINCVMWRKAAENFSKFTRKGSLVGIEGSIQTRNYENQQGQRVYVTEVLANNFSLLEPKSVTEQRPASSDNGSSNYGGFGGNNDNQQPSFGGDDPFGSSFTPDSSNNNNNNDSSANNPFASNSGNDSIDIADDDLPF